MMSEILTPEQVQECSDYYFVSPLARSHEALRADRDRLAAEVERLKAGFVVDGETSDGYHTFNELYAYRKALHALLANEWARRGIYDVHKSWYHSDGEPCFGGGWFIVVAELPEGQVSNHYKAADWALFQVPERERGNTYDGHTPAIALERLLARAALAETREESPEERVTALEAERDRLAAKVERLTVAARDFLDHHSLDCGAHYCRYCPARSPEWNHESYCAYVRSQSAYTALSAVLAEAPKEGQ